MISQSDPRLVKPPLVDRIAGSQAETRLRQQVTVVFAVAVLLTGLLGLLSGRNARRGAQEADGAVHSPQVLATLEATLRHLVDVETGGRGFALTGHEPFLEPYEAGRYAVRQDSRGLRVLVVDNPDQERRLDMLEGQAKAGIEACDTVVAERRRTGGGPAEQLEPGEQIFDAARITVEGMKAEERSLLEQRTQQARAARQSNSFITTLGSLLGMVFLAVAALSVSHQVGVSARARAKVIALNADLERRVAEQTAALEESESRLAGVIQSAMDAIITVDQEQRIVLFNPAAEKVFRCPTAEALGQPMERFIPQRFRSAYSVHIQKFGGTGTTNRVLGELGNLWAVRADGEEFQIEASISQIKTAGKKLFTVILRDVSERKAAEREIQELNHGLEARVLERTAQLEASNKELEAFTYSVSHDLRAPLRHMSGFTKILTEEFGSSLPAEGQHYLQRVGEGARQMGQLVDELLKLARVGRQELSVRVTGLNSVVTSVLTMLEPESQGQEVEWKIGELPFVECDPVLVRQVFQNLIDNALKYSRPRHPAVIEIGTSEQNGRTVIFVRDNGVGFNMKYADKLFGAFQRLHRPEDFEGTGVGLATVQRIIQKHGGRVWAEAELDQGATFYFTLGSGGHSEAKNAATTAGG
jgi:PAS domain S-box-containing protein